MNVVICRWFNALA